MKMDDRTMVLSSKHECDKGAKWLFTAEQLASTPSIKRGMTQDEEMNARQLAACLIRKIGLKIREQTKKPNGLCIDTAMVFMHRFYMFHSFQKFPPRVMAPCALFLAAKCEETPIKLEYVIKTAHMVLNINAPSINTNDKLYAELQKELISNENLLLQTLGFDLIVSHPHTSVITCGDLFGAPKFVTKFAYELATNSLHFTNMCLRLKPTTVACVCLHMAFKRYSLSLPRSTEGKDWWLYLDSEITNDTIQKITDEFLKIITDCQRPFNKWMSHKDPPEGADSRSGSSSSTTARATSSNNNIKLE